MASRKNQQAAREYMRSHPGVSYMEALRRVSPGAGRLPQFTEFSPTSPWRGMFSDLPAGGAQPPSLFCDLPREQPRVLTVAGIPGSGKTVLLRGLLDQHWSHPVLALHSGGLLEGVGSWPGLVTVDSRFGHGIDVLPSPPEPEGLAKGTLVILDISADLAVDTKAQDKLLNAWGPASAGAVAEWVAFFGVLPGLVRRLGVSLAVSVGFPVPGGVSVGFPVSRLRFGKAGEIAPVLAERLVEGVVVETASSVGGRLGSYFYSVPVVGSGVGRFEFSEVAPVPEVLFGEP